MDFPIILMRHGEADHNIAKRTLKKKLKMHKIKTTPQYQAIKYHPRFREDRLTQNGKQQARQASKKIDWSNVSVVLVSPLIRCLETCQIMLMNVDLPIQVIVEPLVASRLTNAWSLGNQKSKLVAEFPNFSFERLQETKVPWFASYAQHQNQGQFRQDKNPLQVMQKTGIEQTYEDFRKRGGEIAEEIDRRIKLCNKKKVLVISHSCTLKLFTATGFLKTGKAISNISFENSDVIYIQRSACFKYISPAPKF